jgi:ketosteroid isomerase-like protein
MNKSVKLLIWPGLWLIFGTLALLGCNGEPMDDETLIRQRIDDMVAATEAKELSKALEPVHEDFLGNQHIRKANLRGILLLHFRRHKNVHVFVNNLEVSVKGREAAVACNVVMAGRNQTLPERARVLQVQSTWKKIGDDWQVVSASWEDPLLNY